MRPVPDLDGYALAQAAKLDKLGSDVTFLAAAVNTWPPGTAINPDTGEPFDPTIEPVSVDQEQFVIRCAVFFKAVNRGGAANAGISSPAGWDERTRIFAIAPYSRRRDVDRSVAFIFHGDTFKIDAIKNDEVIGGYLRLLIYGAEA